MDTTDKTETESGTTQRIDDMKEYASRITDMVFDLETTSSEASVCGVLQVSISCLGLEPDLLEVTYNLGLAEAMINGRASQDTLKWWSEQPADVRLAVMMPPKKDLVSTADMLHDIASVFKLNPNIKVWGYGSEFDIGAMTRLYYEYGMGRPPWSYKNVRCLRTLAAEHPEIERPKSEIPHNATYDSRAQALWLYRLKQAASRPIGRVGASEQRSAEFAEAVRAGLERALNAAKNNS